MTKFPLSGHHFRLWDRLTLETSQIVVIKDDDIITFFSIVFFKCFFNYVCLSVSRVYHVCEKLMHKFYYKKKCDAIQNHNYSML